MHMPNLGGFSVHLPSMSRAIFQVSGDVCCPLPTTTNIIDHQGDIRATRLLTSTAQHYFDLAISEMDTFKFNGHCLDNMLVAMIARLLDNARIPNVLWGNYLLTIYGVPSVVDVSLRVAKFCMV